MDIQTQTRMFEALGRIEANQTSFRNELLGPGGRIVNAEESLKSQKKQVEKHDRAYTFATWAGIPVLGLLHIGLKSILAKLGW